MQLKQYRVLCGSGCLLFVLKLTSVHCPVHGTQHCHAFCAFVTTLWPLNAAFSSTKERKIHQTGLGFVGWMVFLILLLLMQKLLPVQSLLRFSRSVPEGFIAPLELQQKHFGLVDDYGLRPHHPKLQIRKQRKESETLQRAHKSKRDEPNFEEYYYDDVL
ncbi:protein Frey 1 [Candoia aspera]|uniref:protein Frey 1 n=1 Tax=Candoia aspera TaxID=51853 RepID=UPI002FD83D83